MEQINSQIIHDNNSLADTDQLSGAIFNSGKIGG